MADIGPFYTSAQSAKDIASTVQYVKSEIKNTRPQSRRRPSSETGLRIGFLDKDGTMTKCEGDDAGYGDLKLSVVTWDSTAETYKIVAAVGEGEEPAPTIRVYNSMSTEFIGDGENDIKMHYEFGYGAFWITGVDCGAGTEEEEE